MVVHLLFARTTLHHRPLHQLDIKNVFLHDDPEKDTYIE